VASLAFCASGPVSSAHAEPANADAEVTAEPRVLLAPGEDGGIGAFAVRGPFVRRPSSSADDGEVAKKRDTLVLSARGSVDLKKALGVGSKGDAYALLHGTLVVDRPFTGYLLLSGDDGVSVSVDGDTLLDVDVAHPPLDDLEAVKVGLAAGSHAVRVVLHQAGGPWEFRLRLVDAELRPARGVAWAVPTTLTAEALGERLTHLTLDRQPLSDGSGWAPRLLVQTENGFPLDFHGKLTVEATSQDAAHTPLFRIAAGGKNQRRGEPGPRFEVSLPTFLGDDAAALEAAPWSLRATWGSRRQDFVSVARADVRQALGRLHTAQAALASNPSKSLDRESLAATLTYLSTRLTEYASGDDRDGPAQDDEARRAIAFAEAVVRGDDPFHTQRGGVRVAYRSVLDGKPSPFGLFVPKDKQLDGADAPKLPLVIALHGLNGKPMNMLRWAFGRDEDGRNGEWEDRHPGVFPEFPAIVIAPMAHFNTGFRDVAETDVLELVAWAKRHFPIDENRVSITGPSMGGIGSGGIGLRRADLFSAAAPLCGYHTYFLRNDMRPEPKTPWERAIGEHRSNYRWAENGLYLPLYIVHGKKDTPVQNSGVLIDRYEKLGYSVIHEHPDEGHHVWPLFYDDRKGLRWLTSHKRPESPHKVVWKTDAQRYDGAAWLRVTKLEHTLSFGEVTATAKTENGGTTVDVETSGLLGLRLDRDGASVAGPVNVKIGGATLAFAAEEPVQLRRSAGSAAWEKGAFDLAGHKRKGAEGPIRDVLHDPLVFVVGTQDPELTEAHRLVAKAMASVRRGVIIDYPIVDDTALDPTVAASSSLVLIGGPRANSWTAKADAKLPIHVAPGSVVVGKKSMENAALSAVFVFASPFAGPAQPRSIVVAAGASLEATLRLPALPELVPDWVIFDRDVLPAAGAQLLTPGKYVAAGMFDEAWGLSPE
jgi:hypothetical protein